jgi:hypothetical protein
MPRVGACHGISAASSATTCVVFLYSWRYLRHVPVVKYIIPDWLGARFLLDAPIYKDVIFPFLVIVHFFSTVLTAKVWMETEPCISTKGKVGNCGDCLKHSWKSGEVMAGIVGLDAAFYGAALAGLVVIQVMHPRFSAALGGIRGTLFTATKYFAAVAAMRILLEGAKMLFDYESVLLNLVSPSLKDHLRTCWKTEETSAKSSEIELKCGFKATSAVLRKRLDRMPKTLVKLAMLRSMADTVYIIGLAGVLGIMWFAVNWIVNRTVMQENMAEAAEKGELQAGSVGESIGAQERKKEIQKREENVENQGTEKEPEEEKEKEKDEEEEEGTEEEKKEKEKGETEGTDTKTLNKEEPEGKNPRG